MQAQGRLQCWNADGAGKGQATTLEQQRLTARGLGGSCREEAMQQLEDCKGGGRWRGSTPPVEGFRGFRGFKPALSLHRQRSSIAACPLPAHSPLLLGHSSLPFASLQTLKTPKTPKTLHRRCGTCFVIALCY